MKNLLRLIMITTLGLTLTLGLFGCGKTDDEKAEAKQKTTKATAERLVSEHTAISAYFTSMGAPSISWSDADLAEYKEKIDRFESIENQLHNNIDNKDGVQIYGGNNQDVINNLRAAVSNIIEQKALIRAQAKSKTKKEESKNSAQKTESTKTDLSQIKSIKEALELMDDLQKDEQKNLKKLMSLGAPNENWSEDKENQYLSLLDNIITSNQISLKIIKKFNIDQLPSGQDLKERVQDTLTNTKGAKKTAKELFKFYDSQRQKV